MVSARIEYELTATIYRFDEIKCIVTQFSIRYNKASFGNSLSLIVLFLLLGFEPHFEEILSIMIGTYSTHVRISNQQSD